jgi:hypothetical protein
MNSPIINRRGLESAQPVQAEESSRWNGFKVSVKNNAHPIFFVLALLASAAVVFCAVHFSGPKTGGMEM